jgi:Sigma-70 region 2
MTSPVPIPVSEPALIDRARAGDGDAFAALVEIHAELVYRMLRSFSLEPWEAEEVAKEVFVRAWRGLARFEGRAQLTSWLYRIAFNEGQRRLPAGLLPPHHRDRTGKTPSMSCRMPPVRSRRQGASPRAGTEHLVGPGRATLRMARGSGAARH